ncbi:MAG: glycosyltransferase family 4 protein [Actinobacteria bacterium]|nr:glycosyltransferase family 4 protein [Actinomycetota bacterium]
MGRALHQLVPSLRVGDAVGGHTLRVRDALRDLDLESEIFVENSHPAVAAETRHIDDYVEYTRTSGAQLAGVMYQLAVGANTAELFFALSEPKIVDYHNITPPEYFSGWDDYEAMRTRVGRTQMERLGRRCDLALGDSSYNVADLTEHGYACPTEVVPILLDLSAFDREVDERALARLERAKGDGGSDWLFVGRFAPNKCQHDLLKAFAAYRRTHDPRARLHLAGSEGPTRYVKALHRLAADAGVGGAVTFHTGVPSGVLSALYRAADVFVCLSEHEGFCIPLLEAMHHRVPVVAFAAAAVPETLGGAGLLLTDKRPLTVAHAVDRLLTDAGLRARMVAAGRERLADFSLDRTRARLVEALAPVLNGSPGR